MAIDPRATFAPGLLDGRRIVLVGVPEPVAAPIAGLGADLRTLDDPAAEDEALRAWCEEQGSLQGVLVDVSAAAGAGDADGLARALELAWRGVRAVATGSLIPAGEGGRIVLIAPPPAAGPLAGAAAAGLENLARTLSVEWARHGITAVCLAPGDATGDAELSALAAFVLSDAGGYLSGCRFDLRGR